MIIAGQVTREGTYVALTRAREQTHLYAAEPEHMPAGADPLAHLAARVSQSEPEVPSISTPLAHEAVITAGTEQEALREITRQPQQPAAIRLAHDTDPAADRSHTATPENHGRDIHKLASEQAEHTLDTTDRPAVSPVIAKQPQEPVPARAWPGREQPRLAQDGGLHPDRLERDNTPGWEM